MRRKQQQPLSVEQYVIPPDGGLITRFPSNQTFRKNYSGLSVASNVRAVSGRLYNAPGYELAPFAPALDSPILLVTDVELLDSLFHVVGDCSSLFAVTQFIPLSVSAGQGGVTAGLSFRFADAAAVSSQGGNLGVTWTRVSGPGNATFDDAGNPTATATVDAPGLYEFQMEASDGVTTASSTCQVRFITCAVSPASYTFPDYTGGSTVLTGEILGGSDPSNPFSDGATFAWSQVSGPDDATIDYTSGSLTPTIIIPRTVPNGTPVEYVFALIVSVGVTSSPSQAAVTVPSPPPKTITWYSGGASSTRPYIELFLDSAIVPISPNDGDVFTFYVEAAMAIGANLANPISQSTEEGFSITGPSQGNEPDLVLLPSSNMRIDGDLGGTYNSYLRSTVDPMWDTNEFIFRDVILVEKSVATTETQNVYSLGGDFYFYSFGSTGPITVLMSIQLGFVFA